MIVSLPKSLKRDVEDFATTESVSFNQYTGLALADRIGARGATEFFSERGKNGAVDWAIGFPVSRPECCGARVAHHSFAFFQRQRNRYSVS